MTIETGIGDGGRSGTYRALPTLEDEVMNLVLRYAVGADGHSAGRRA